MSKRFRVAVADDFRISRRFFEGYVESASDYELTKSLHSASDAVAYCIEAQPDLLLLDVLMRSGMDGLTAAAEIKKRRLKTKIILATSTAEDAWVKRARAIGVDGFWYKEYSEMSLLEIMDRVMAGETVYPDTPPNVSFGRISRSDLTERELDVLRELTGGYTNEGIAERLGISINTVRTHLQNILNKTGFDNRLDLAMNAKSIGLVVNDNDLIRS